MDYLCELPNDAARRKALNSLPPDLNSTYERILSRVNQRPSETQKLVRRALRWIITGRLKTEALCEAVSVDLGSKNRDCQAIPDEDDILRWCSSLVRKSADGQRLELAHFTVQEYLQQIDPNRDTLIGAYRVDWEADEIFCFKVCLTYLNYEDFNYSSPFSKQVIERRLQEYPFREHAIDIFWLISPGIQDDDEIFSLLQKLLSPTKPNTFILWMHDRMLDHYDELPEKFLNSGFAETSALHWAAMLSFDRVCSWRIESGCDVNRDSAFGTPLHCALMGSAAFDNTNPGSIHLAHVDSAYNIADLLIEAGADTNCYYEFGTQRFSFLYIALSASYHKRVIQLLDNGELLDRHCLDKLKYLVDEDIDHEEICGIINRTSLINVQPVHYGLLLQITARANTTHVLHSTKKINSLAFPKTHYELMLRTAAELGQVEIVKSLLEDHKLDLNAADERTGLTALHQAARTDQLVVVQILIDHGADWSKLDGQGRTALHHATQGRELCCLKFLLCRDTDTNLQGIEGKKVRQVVAQESILPSKIVNLTSMIGLKAKDGRTPLLYASANRSEEAIRLLINAGSSLSDTATDGSSALHYAASSGSVQVVNFIFEQDFDPSVATHDGSNAIHYAIENSGENITEILQILIENGVNPFQPRNDGCTPLDIIVRIIKAKYDLDSFSSASNRLFDASPTLLKSVLDKSDAASNMKKGAELIYLACSFYFTSAHETVSTLLQLGLDCNTRLDGGRTALMAAAENGRGAILSTLLLHGADPRASNSGLTPIHCACLNDHDDVLVRLRGTSIDWNSKATIKLFDVQRTSVTALHIAAQNTSSKTLEYLLNEDLMSDINARTSAGETPLWGAVWARSPHNVSLLLSNGADTSSVDHVGNTAMHWAAINGDEHIITELIASGSDFGLPNRGGLTPELLARREGHAYLANIIMDYVNEQGVYRYYIPMLLCGLSNSMFL